MKAGYRFGPTIIDVETDDAGSGAWLSEFLHPWADATPHGHGDRLVRMTSSAAAFDALGRRQAVSSLRQVPCFALDSQVVSLPGWDNDRGTVVADAELGCFFCLAGRVVEVVARPGCARARIGLMRVVREALAAPALAGADYIDLHAAAFAVAGQAVLLAGPKGSGKTTMLIHALASGRADLLANDRVFIHGSPEPAGAVGVPTLVSIRPWTLQVFPRLRKDAAERSASLRVGEPAPPRVEDGTAAETRDFALSPAQLAHRLGVAMARDAPIAAVVFPVITPATDTWTFEPVSPADAAARLRECLYGARVEPRAPTVFEGTRRGVPRRAQQSAVVERLAARVPCVQGNLGPGACRDSAGVWLRALGLDVATAVPAR